MQARDDSTTVLLQNVCQGNYDNYEQNWILQATDGSAKDLSFSAPKSATCWIEVAGNQSGENHRGLVPETKNCAFTGRDDSGAGIPVTTLACGGKVSRALKLQTWHSALCFGATAFGPLGADTCIGSAFFGRDVSSEGLSSESETLHASSEVAGVSWKVSLHGPSVLVAGRARNALSFSLQAMYLASCAAIGKAEPKSYRCLCRIKGAGQTAHVDKINMPQTDTTLKIIRAGASSLLSLVLAKVSALI